MYYWAISENEAILIRAEKSGTGLYFCKALNKSFPRSRLFFTKKKALDSLKVEK